MDFPFVGIVQIKTEEETVVDVIHGHDEVTIQKLIYTQFDHVIRQRGCSVTCVIQRKRTEVKWQRN